MARLIDATRIEQYILNNCSDNEEINAIYAEIVNAPTVDAEPVKHGHWEKVKEQPYFRKHFHNVACSECHREGVEKWNYCPHCGAKMSDE